ncbi:hypothetical protein V6N13_009572 [Hibiscus sabdariffa]|uniref:Uncharacterized protein n=1 Tax=Hibiscus sabdariffa TaxID=183260 RepID=A0ABR2A930_9ROSI
MALRHDQPAWTHHVRKSSWRSKASKNRTWCMRGSKILRLGRSRGAPNLTRTQDCIIYQNHKRSLENRCSNVFEEYQHFTSIKSLPTGMPVKYWYSSNIDDKHQFFNFLKHQQGY